MHMRQPLRNYFGSDLLITIEDMPSLEESPWPSDQRAMVFEAGFRVNVVIVFAIVFVIVLCHVDSPNPWSVGHTGI